MNICLLSVPNIALNPKAYPRNLPTLLFLIIHHPKKIQNISLRFLKAFLYIDIKMMKLYDVFTLKREFIMKNLKILAPVDFSDLSAKGLKAANNLAKLFNGSVTPFHAYIPLTDLDGFHYMGSGFTSQENLTDIEKVITQRLLDIAADHVDVGHLNDGILGIGNPAHAIVETSVDFDMIVMSTHGRTGFTRFLLGSVAEKVLRMSHKPVLVVEDDSTLVPMKKIMVTTDFSTNSEAAFPWAKKIAETTGAEIDLFHAVIYDEFESVEKAESTFEIRKESLKKIAETAFAGLNSKVNIRIKTTDRSAQDAILQQTKEESYNLVVISTIGRTGFDYLMLGSTASSVTRLVKAAVLSVSTEKQIEKKLEIIKDSP